MNNTLDFNRLGKVIRRDGMNYIPNFGWSLVILWAIPLVVWLLGFVVEQYGGEITGRASLLRFLSSIALIVAPAKLYKDCNDSRKGIQYAMMPASTLEKFLSMFLFCVIVTPIAYMVGAVTLDTIMAAFPGKNPYEGFIFKSLFDPFQQGRLFSTAFGAPNYAFDNYYNELNAFFTIPVILSSKILSTVAVASIFMFGNMIFKKRKTSKMIGVLVILFIIIMIVFIKYCSTLDYQPVDMNDEEALKAFMLHSVKLTIHISMLLSFIISAVMLGLTYYKIKTQKY